MHKVYLSLGSNLGRKIEHLRQAVEAIKDIGEVINSSSIYETDPWGYIDQPAFYNQVILIETRLEPAALLTAIKGFERKIGRAPTFRYGPRVIDIDILLYDELQLITPELTIPHPEMKNRVFVLLPLMELDSKIMIPGEEASIKELLGKLENKGIRKIEEADGGQN